MFSSSYCDIWFFRKIEKKRIRIQQKQRNIEQPIRATTVKTIIVEILIPLLWADEVWQRVKILKEGALLAKDFWLGQQVLTHWAQLFKVDTTGVLQKRKVKLF